MLITIGLLLQTPSLTNIELILHPNAEIKLKKI